MNDSNAPITGICLVSKPSNVPTGYHCIRKGKETRDSMARELCMLLAECGTVPVRCWPEMSAERRHACESIHGEDRRR